jgi:1-acyl-sn-glycerol-3-phosphate acyltransferase
MKYLVTIGFWLWFAVTAPVCVVLAVPLWLLTLPFDKNHAALHVLVCRWCNYLYLRAWPGWRVRVEGRELLPKGPAIIVSNHRSAADILCNMGLFHPFKFVAKASLFRTPMVGWLMTLMEYVPVVRGTANAMDKMLADCRKWLHRGVPVLIFPEGTYAPSRQPLPFKRGAFRLAIEEKVPIVPVVLEGTTEVVDGDGPWMGPRASVRVRVLPPLAPESLGSDDVALAERVRGLYFDALGLPRLSEGGGDERKPHQCA